MRELHQPRYSLKQYSRLPSLLVVEIYW